ncbi:hypothetical protein BJY04DRAFT_217299 [Aspergillus karnatakaensis]|uniref:syntaxin n=1 Tax=Aspergillus karnatakaensis TaxID=1810916 RepID=UPI003CCDA1FE
MSVRFQALAVPHRWESSDPLTYQQQSSYGDAYAPYGQQQQNSYGGQQGYGQNPYAAQDVELQQQPRATNATDPRALLDRCTRLNASIAEVREKRETRLAAAQNALLQSNNTNEDKAANEALGLVTRDLNNALTNLKDEFARIKNTPGSGDSLCENQIRQSGRKLTEEIQELQKTQKHFRDQLKEQMHRRIAIAEPTLSSEEIQQRYEEVTAGQAQVFQVRYPTTVFPAVMLIEFQKVTGARTQKGRDTYEAVANRSQAIKSATENLVILHELIEQLAEAIVRQEPAVQQIEQGAENVAGDLEGANRQLGQAVVSARKARKWKWYALIIIIIIIAIIVAVAVGVTQS